MKLGDAGFLFGSTVIVNAGNYLINLILGRVLGPERFSEASVIATGVLMLSFFAVGLQLCSAKFNAQYFASNDQTQIGKFNTWFDRKVLIFSIGISVVLIVASRAIQDYLQFKSFWPIVIIGIGIPFYFQMSTRRGYVQGTDQFRKMAFTYLFEMILRFVFTFSILYTVLEYYDSLTTEAVSVGFFFSFLAAIWVRLPKMDIKEKFEDQKVVYSFIGIIIVYEFSQILINNSDVILTKHFFDELNAGLYAAVALIGRVVFFGTWTIVTILFPKVIQKEKLGEPHLPLFWMSFAIVLFFGVMITGICYAMPEMIIGLLFGEEYLSVSHLLWKYAVATSLFACANVFAYYYMSLEKYAPVVLSVIAGVAQIVLIYIYHDTIEQIIYVQILLMFALLISMVIFQFFNAWTLRKIKLSIL
ncbi:MAG: sugar isomerase [Bacteroidia bacterium]|nr:sugar isomerase [Bacteroidia bacterium]